MISFIIIGKNEGWKITNCLKSIFLTILNNNLEHFEVLYIDSKSTDDSIERVLNFPDVKIFKINGKSNAAIARNIGALESKGDFLFFIDGDMEIFPEVFNLLYTNEKGLLYEYCSGDFINYYYDQQGNYLNKTKQYNLARNIYQEITGGLFLIKREIWYDFNGMRNIFRISEDLDFGLRLSKKNIKLLRIKEVLAIHHTIDYEEKNKFLLNLKKGTFLYRGLLYKKNICNITIYKLYIKKEISLFYLCYSAISYIVIGNYWLFLFYPVLLSARSIYNKKESFSKILLFAFKYLIYDLNTILSLMFFWPKNQKQPSYSAIKSISD